MTSARVLGAATAAAVFALDQAAKFAAVRGFAGEAPQSRPVTPFLDLTLHWNTGISFSLLPQNSPLGVWLLLAFTLAATALLGVWLARARAPIVGLALGAIIGGALGNACDRLVYGAVVDFLDLHALGRHFFVFNLADAAINVGVALLVLDALFGRGAGAKFGSPAS